jgi:hypothetical protein
MEFLESLTGIDGLARDSNDDLAPSFGSHIVGARRGLARTD